jgi:hypothetical protein
VNPFAVVQWGLLHLLGESTPASVNNKVDDDHRPRRDAPCGDAPHQVRPEAVVEVDDLSFLSLWWAADSFQSPQIQQVSGNPSGEVPLRKAMKRASSALTEPVESAPFQVVAFPRRPPPCRASAAASEAFKVFRPED